MDGPAGRGHPGVDSGGRRRRRLVGWPRRMEHHRIELGTRGDRGGRSSSGPRLPVTHLAAVALAAAALGAPLPAAADSARPTNYRSEVTSIEPPNGGVSADVVGGDAFLRIEAAPGVTVEVPGYEGEPYVRIGADGTVEVNRNSPSYWVNEDRFGARAVPPELRWTPTGLADGGGRWHLRLARSSDPLDVARPTTGSKARLCRRSSSGWSLCRSTEIPSRSTDSSSGAEHRPDPWLALSAVAVAVAFVPMTALLVRSGSRHRCRRRPSRRSLPSGRSTDRWPGSRLGGSGARGVGGVPGAPPPDDRGGNGRRLAWAVSRFPALWMPSLPSSLPAGLDAPRPRWRRVGLGGIVAAYRDLQKGAGG